jgi:hypothetical protein
LGSVDAVQVQNLCRTQRPSQVSFYAIVENIVENIVEWLELAQLFRKGACTRHIGLAISPFII